MINNTEDVVHSSGSCDTMLATWHSDGNVERSDYVTIALRNVAPEGNPSSRIEGTR